jgi:outer membrane protein OmpA-like peptidoglycan-associated protein
MKFFFAFLCLLPSVLPLSAQSTRSPLERIDSLSNEIATSTWNLSGVLLSKGLSFRVRNLPFSDNGQTFTTESVPILDSLADFLRLNPNIHLRISVYFSNDTPESTLKRSRTQAKSIANYIANRKVNSKRLRCAKGGNMHPLYPESLLLDLQSANLQAQYRALNNRIEFEIAANLN